MVAIGTLEDTQLKEITSDLTEYLVNIFGSKLKQIILFGSYARGDHDEWSDLDLMVLVDEEDQVIKTHDADIAGLMSDIAIKYGVIPSVIEKNYNHFYHWAEFLPFYSNVLDEGVVIYES